MRKLFWLLLIALIAAAAIWYGLRVAEKNATMAITSLLPGDTLLVVHLSDFNRTRDQWHQTDIYKIRQEPEVRDFLEKPLSKIPKSGTTSQNLAEFESLEPKDIFFAVTSWTNGLKLAGGFRFKGKADDAEKILGNWRAKLRAKSSDAKSEVVEYEQHRIQTVTAKGQVLATVYDGSWFLAANDVAELKVILDRIDGRLKDPAATLAGDSTFSAAFKHMPASYSSLIYGRVDRYFEKVMPLLGTSGTNDQGTPVYRQIHAFCGALTFDGGKIRDVLFLGMPQLVNAGPLTRSSLVLGTKETFFYLASFLNLSNQMNWPPGVPASSGLPGAMQKLVDAVSSSGTTMQEWNAAFGPEVGTLADWATGAQWPMLTASLPVKDPAKAAQLLTKMTTSADGGAWTQQEKDGVKYFSMPTGGRLFSIAPTLALSDKMLIAGSNESVVEAAVKRSAVAKSELGSSENFRKAEAAVPPAKQAFFYVDTALLYARLDAAIRPLLMMSAAFMPSVSENVDLSKFPPPEAITKHLSPIVMSQNYQSDGYVTESVGPVTIYQAAAGAALVGVAAGMWYQQQAHGGAFSNLVPSFSPPSGQSPTPFPSRNPNSTP
jgi:Protein of unknown function (DUF3352)